MLELLFDNPFLVVILIGIISSLFGKSKSTQEEEQKKRQRPQQQQTRPVETGSRTVRESRPQPSPFDEMRRQMEEVRRQMEGRPVQQPTFHEVTVDVESEFDKKRKEQAAKLKKLQEKQRLIEKAADELHTGMKKQQQIQEANQTSASNDPFPSYGSRLIDGIVLSEVLGKPRAKNPHTSRRF